MRPIKFRAWDKVGKRMVYQDWNSFRNWYSESNVGKVVYARGFDGEKLTLSEPMQFTGLLDKNGKEIWEGDILQSQFSSGEIEWVGEVVWTESERMDNGYNCSNKNYGWHVKTKGFTAILRTYQKLKVCEERIAGNGGIFVVGNHYENPGLLGDRHE